MCGIFGVTNFNTSALKLARESLDTLQHRGPDQWNDYYDEYVYLGHRRLSIMDLSKQGIQPMVSTDKNVLITVNGEVYNFLELKNELQEKYQFVSTSDSEVILHGYKEWGIDLLLKKIDGMYAFSIYDKKNKKLFLARDRVGIKPLYYSDMNGQISYASELKAIQRYYGDSLTIDYTALYDFLTYRYIPAPKTMYQHVFKLEPGHYLEIDLENGSRNDVQYWKLEIQPCDDNIEQACEKIYDLVKQSVDEQMMSDVPVGFFLSGGLDSSTVVTMASKIASDINTFSIGFTDKDHDETHFADIIAEKLQTKHHKKILDEDQTKCLLKELKSWYDEPFADFSCFPTYLVSEYARENATVVLTGDGGDEVFGGYAWYERFQKKSQFRFPSLSFLRVFTKPFMKQDNIFTKIARRIEHPYLYNDFELYTKLMNGLLRQDKEKYRKKWGISEEYDDYWSYRKYYREDLDIYTRLQFLDFHTFLPDDILTKVDRVSMAVSLECRVPLLSKEIVEYLFSLSPEVRYHNDELKGAMKEAFKNEIPDEILNREKKGFSIPMETWREEIMDKSQNVRMFVLNEIFDIW